MTDNKDLKPCPFCEEANMLSVVGAKGFGFHGWCQACNTCGPSKPTEAEARAAWNAQRAEPAELSRASATAQEPVEQLRHIVAFVGLAAQNTPFMPVGKVMDDAMRNVPEPAAAETSGAMQDTELQPRVYPWLIACFGAEIASDKIERNHRFLEESLELVQSLGCTQDEAHKLVDYTFGRPQGEPPQEVGGVMITLAALCLANGLNMHRCGDAELVRIWSKVDVIREKQKRKPAMSPLPGVYPERLIPAPSVAEPATQRGKSDE